MERTIFVIKSRGGGRSYVIVVLVGDTGLWVMIALLVVTTTSSAMVLFWFLSSQGKYQLLFVLPQYCGIVVFEQGGVNGINDTKFENNRTIPSIVR